MTANWNASRASTTSRSSRTLFSRSRPRKRCTEQMLKWDRVCGLGSSNGSTGVLVAHLLDVLVLAVVLAIAMQMRVTRNRIATMRRKRQDHSHNNGHNSDHNRARNSKSGLRVPHHASLPVTNLTEKHTRNVSLRRRCTWCTCLVLELTCTSHERRDDRSQINISTCMQVQIRLCNCISRTFARTCMCTCTGVGTTTRRGSNGALF